MSRAPNGYRNMSNGSNPSNPSMVAGNAPQSRLAAPTPQQQASSAGMSRAERFEDEKRRIIESCFSKVAQNGQLSESYITHIRVQEDAHYPSTPPPPESPPDNKKSRLIIIAVRSTGRVRMHKARENTNGSFSIGKTWNLEELSAIESFSNPNDPLSDPNTRQHREWAGNVGFTVTVSKPYFWQAGTPKEKDFFVASLVKIYRKYTKGQVPQLRGFNAQETASITGQQAPAQAPANASATELPRPPFAVQDRSGSRDESRYRQSPGPPGSISEQRPSSAARQHPSESPARDPSAQGVRAMVQQPSPYASQEASQQPVRPFATERPRANSREGLRPGTAPGRGGFGPPGPPPDSVLQTPSAQSSQSDLRPENPGVSSIPSSTREQVQKTGQEPSSLRSGSPGRQPSYSQSVEAVPEQRRADAQTNGNAGAALFSNAKDRWMVQAPPVDQRQTPQRPPAIQTFQPAPKIAEPITAESEASSGFDLGDAAAIGAIPSFWGPEPTHTAPPPVYSQQAPGSPPTPERRRPPLETQKSGNSFDLRPPPLKQGMRTQIPDSQDNSRYATPLAISNHAKPRTEEAPSIPPLSVNKEVGLAMPGAFSPASSLRRSPLGSPAVTPGDTPADEPTEEETHRPGLGPMIRKQRVAERFKKAATAINAFKPRPGGPAAKILAEKARRENEIEPDGITGVVPRPSMARKESKDESRVASPNLAIKQPEPQTREMAEEALPKLRVSSPVALPLLQSPAMVDGAHVEFEPIVSPPPQEDNAPKEERAMPAPEPKKVKRRSYQQDQYLASLGIDSRQLESRGLDYDAMLSDFGWSSGMLSAKKLDDLDADVKRELGRVEAGSWLGHLEQKDERVEHVERMLDRAIAECDELEGLLTLYSVELSSLNDDVAFIEAQSQGLQVQTANQKLLHTELTTLVNTISISQQQLQPLRYADLTEPRSLVEVEASLVMLYKAMLTMDPAARATVGDRPNSRMGESEVSSMAALQEKRNAYMQESTNFCQRLMQHLDFTFTTSLNNAATDVARPSTSSRGSSGGFKINTQAFSSARIGLWQYSPLLLYAKELDPPAWQTLLRFYHSRAKPLYNKTFKDNIAAWKRTVRKPTGEETDILFTAQEKEASDGLSSTARKLTVKRSQTLARGLRTAKTSSPLDDRSPGSFMASEAFAHALDELAPLVGQEQNFVVDLFHATSLETVDFPDAVRDPPDHRRGTDLKARKPVEPDRDMARRVTGVMEEIFGFFGTELGELVAWTIENDPVQGVGIMTALARHAFFLADSSQEFLLHVIDALSQSLHIQFAKFVDTQIHAIEETKVKIKKRKGVIAFVKIFPQFSSAVESIFSAVAGEDAGAHNAESVYEVRKVIDDAYGRINRAMFDSLKVIAKESPSAPVAASGQPAALAGRATEDRDKKMLNYHILLIENFNHYIEEVEDGGKEGVLAEWKGRAMLERLEALEEYVKRVVRRPLGKLLDFVESIEAILESNPTARSAPTTVASRPSYSRKAMRSLLAQYDGREMRKGIDTLRKRIEKHFGDADEEALSRGLVAFVCKECERRYDGVLERTVKVVEEVYPAAEGEKNVGVEWTREDVAAGFRR